MDPNSPPQPFRSGLVALAGPPNAGKSTLLNRLLGQKISIVSPKPQTTRNRIAGVLNGDGYQIVFLDTPGLHSPGQLLNREMVRIATESLVDVDAVVYLLDSARKKTREEAAESGKYLGRTTVPVFLALNKVDLVAKAELLPLIETCRDCFDFRSIIPLSARTGENTDRLVAEILAVLQPGPRYFPEDVPTDVSERFLVGEIVREKVFLLTGQEIPYSTAVVVEAFQEGEKGVTIHATIVLEKASQKGIVIGKGGHKLKSIGTAARKDMERLLGEKVLLKLWVKVKKNWTQSNSFLRDLGL